MAKTVKRMAQYRSASFLVNSRVPLQALLEDAVGRLPDQKQRVRQIDEDTNESLGTFANVRGMFCGMFERWVTGRNQLVLDRTEDGGSWPVHEVAPPEPTDAKVQREFLPYVSYFAVYDNHLAVVLGAAIRPTDLSSYFTWLLRDKCNDLLNDGDQIDLQPASARRLRELAIDTAKAVRITRPLAKKERKERTSDTITTKAKVEKVIDGKEAKALTDVFGILGLEMPTNLLLEGEARDLEILLEIKRPRLRRQESNAVMNALAQLAVGKETEDYTIILQDDSQVKGNNLKLKRGLTVSLDDTLTFPAPMAVFVNIQEYLHELIVGGSV